MLSIVGVLDDRGKGILRTLAICLLASTGIGILKLLYGYSTDSLAFVADGVHSLFDSCATLTGMFSVFLSSRPPDEEHPYGHRKYETVAALALGLILVFAAYEVGHAAYERISSPNHVPNTSFGGIAIVLVSLIVSLAVSRFEARQARELDSHLLVADSLHNASDVWVSIGVLASVIFTEFRVPYADTGVSLAISIYLLVLAVRLTMHSLRPLVDSSVLDSDRVAEIASAVPGVLHCHHIRSRGEGGYYFLDLNLHLPGQMSLNQAHEIAHRVESRLKSSFPGLVDVVIHTEPDDHPPCRVS